MGSHGKTNKKTHVCTSHSTKTAPKGTGNSQSLGVVDLSELLPGANQFSRTILDQGTYEYQPVDTRGIAIQVSVVASHLHGMTLILVGSRSHHCMGSHTGQHKI